MNPREAEKLLGGYATGTLTEAERRALFAAALEDQALFDALADEEALRELLEDPAARARLLAVLDGSAARRAVPFWRRPATMGLAATLLLAAGVGVALRRVPVPGQPPPAAPTLEAGPRLMPAGKPEAPPAAQAPAPSAAPKTFRRSVTPPAPMSAAEATPPADASLRARNEAAPPPALAKDAKAEARAAEPEKRAKAADAAASALGHAGPLAAFAARALPRPAWELSRDPGGAFTLTVLWGPEGHLYLLHRRPSGVSALEPLSTLPREGGKQESRFAGTAEAGDALDLYLLPEAAQAPAALPAEGPVPGFRARVWP